MPAKLSPLLLALLVQTPNLLGTTFTVLNTDASGPGSFEQAILDANGAPGLDDIAFNIPGDGPHIIRDTSIPAITSPVVINGFSQPDAQPNAITTANDAILKIQIDGNGTANACLTFNAGGNAIRGLSITRFLGDAIRINTGANDNVIAGNFLGININPADATDGGNRVGVSINSANNTIGGTTPAAANVIGDNSQYGILIQTAGGNNNVILGNLIGFAANGTRKANSKPPTSAPVVAIPAATETSGAIPPTATPPNAEPGATPTLIGGGSNPAPVAAAPVATQPPATAAPAASADSTGVKFCARLSGDTCAQGRTTFVTTTANIFADWTVPQIKDGSQFRVVWYRNGQPIGTADSCVVQGKVCSSNPADINPGWGVFRLSTLTNRRGNYSFRLFISNSPVPALEGKFTVQ